MTGGAIDLATVLRRVDQIVSAGRAATGDAEGTLSITFKRLDALAEDLHKGLCDHEGGAA